MSFFTNLLAGNVGVLLSVSDVAKVVRSTPTSDAPPGFSDTQKYLEDCAKNGLLKVAERRKEQTGGTRPEMIKERTEYDPRRGVWETRYEVRGSSYSPPIFTETLMIDRDDFAKFLKGPAGKYLPGREESAGLGLWCGPDTSALNSTLIAPPSEDDTLIPKVEAKRLVSCTWEGHTRPLDHLGDYPWLDGCYVRRGNKTLYHKKKLLFAYAAQFGKPADQSAAATVQEVLRVLNSSAA